MSAPTIETAKLPWHCMTEGPWWKRWRIRWFGLTSSEMADNFYSFRIMQGQAMREMIEQDAEDEIDVQEMVRSSKSAA